MAMNRQKKSLLAGGVVAAIAIGSLVLAARSREPEMPQDPVQQGMLCRQQDEAKNRAEAEAQRQQQIALVARLKGADPARDAAAAAARGDFRLIRGISMAGIFPLGVDCR